MHTFTKVGLDALLTPENGAVLLIDRQPSPFGTTTALFMLAVVSLSCKRCASMQWVTRVRPMAGVRFETA
jgi:hypothetical protein